MTNGLLLEVRADDLATAATAAVAVGATSVPVENLTPFGDEAGKVDIAGVTYDYLGVDESTVNADGEGGLLLLASPLTVAVEEFDPVSVIVGGQVAVDVVAVVDLGEDDTDGEYVEVPLDTREERVAWPVGTYDPPLPVTLADDLSSIIAAPSVMPVLDGSLIDPDTLPKTPGQTFSADPPPADATGYAEDFAWWQVVDGEVQGFWRVVGGLWVAQDVVTADALTAKNALIDALNVTDLSTINLSAVNINGGSIAIAQSNADSHTVAFSGTTLPAGWTISKSTVGTVTTPDPHVIDTGVPTGGNGSALLVDYGTTGRTSTVVTWTIDTSYDASDWEILLKHQWKKSLSQTTASLCEVRFNVNASGEYYRLELWPDAAYFGDTLSGPGYVWNSGSDWVSGAWYWVRVRKVAGKIEAKRWRDGTAEPTRGTVRQLATDFDAGSIQIVANENLAGVGVVSDGQDLWIDQFNLTAIATGFKVNPDGSGGWDVLETTRSGGISTGTFAGTGAANAVTIPITFSKPFAAGKIPNVQVFAHGDPTTFILWATSPSETGFTLNVYRTTGTGSFTGRYIAAISH